MKSDFFGTVLSVILLAIGFHIAGCAGVWGSDWKMYEEGAYYDSESMIRQDDGTVRVWQKLVLRNENKTEIWSLRELNCSNRTFRNLTIFERERGEDNNTDVNPKQVHHIEPDSHMERFLKIICR